MARRIHLKDPAAENRLTRSRALTAALLVTLLLGVLVVRLFYLQVLNHEHFITLSHDNRVKLVAVPPTRGLIYDRNGVLLAENLPAYRLEIIPEQVKDMKATLDKLAGLIQINSTDIQRFNRLRRRKPRFEGIPLRFRLTDEEVARFAVNRHRFPGVDIAAHPSRHYPLGAHAVHVLGYVGRIDEDELQRLDPANYRGTSHVGKVGIEKTYEDLLHGKVGYQRVETNALGRVLRVLEDTPPEPGRNLYLTIDSRLQAATEKALKGHSGAIVAIDPRNGDVLALVSQPGYDPNLFVNGIDTKTYGSLRDDPDQPLFNRALRGQYPPGSTVKPFMGLAGLEYAVVRDNQRVFCPGYYVLPNDDHKYRDWKRRGHGSVDLDQAIVESCDVYFYDLALTLGIDRIHAFLTQFGFGERTGVDLVGELPGLLPSREWKRQVRNQPWFPGETLITGIGQGFTLATPLQLAAATAALAAHGERFKPRTVYAVEDPANGGMYPEPPAPLPHISVADEHHWNSIIASMTRVIHSAHGTARRIGADAPYKIAGKTGTAQVFGIKQEEEYEEDDIAPELRDHALFIAFAPADDPRIAVAVVVEHGGSGGAVAAPIARKVMDQYFKADTP